VTLLRAAVEERGEPPHQETHRASRGSAAPAQTGPSGPPEAAASRIVFTHRIEPGAADRSFGIEVARLAGLPPAVLERAREVADAIEPLSAEVARRLGTVTGS
jgi:hypothetical protein